MRFFERLNDRADASAKSEDNLLTGTPVTEIPWDIAPPAPAPRYEVKATLIVSIHDYHSGRTAHEFTVRGEEEVRTDRATIEEGVARAGHSLLNQANRLARAADENLGETA